MTTNYHTPHSVAAPLTSAEVNSPLGELDAAISALYSDSTFATFNAKTVFGAVGDGVVDDTAALQAMFDAAMAAGGGVCYIPSGTYKVSSMLELPYPCRVIGDGRQLTTLQYTGSTGTVMRFKNFATSAQRLWVEIGGFTLANTGAATNCTAMNLKGITNGYVHDLYLQDFTGATAVCILVDASYGSAVGAWWNTFERIRTNFCGTGIKFTGVVGNGQANENVVRDCAIIGSSVAAVQVEVGDNILVERSDLTTAQGGVGVILQHRGGTVRHCRFESCQTGVYIKTGTGTLTGNSVVDSMFVGSATTDYGIRVDSGAVRSDIGGNRFSGSYNISKYKDDTTGNTTSKPSAFPIYFTQQNIAASQTSVALVPVGADAGNTRVYVSRPYRIRGVTCRLNANPTAGTLAVHATIGGTDTGLVANASIGSAVFGAWQGLGLDEDGGSSGIGASITTNGAWLPTTDDITVIVWVEWQEEQ